MSTDCAPLSADLYLYTYEYDFRDTFITSKRLHLAKRFNNTFRYIDDLISLNNKPFGIHINNIYPSELELTETTESSNSASYLDLHALAYIKDHPTFQLYDKSDNFNFPIVNFPDLDSSIPVKLAYGVYISQLIRYNWTCS